MNRDEERGYCACQVVRYMPIHNDDGTNTEQWACELCGTVFVKGCKLDRYEKGDTKQWILDEIELRKERDYWKMLAEQRGEALDTACIKDQEQKSRLDSAKRYCKEVIGRDDVNDSFRRGAAAAAANVLNELNGAVKHPVVERQARNCLRVNCYDEALPDHNFCAAHLPGV